MKTKHLFLSLLVTSCFIFTNCDKDDDDSDPFLVTQDQLNNAIASIKNFTGGTFAHGGPDGISADSTIRKVFGSKSDLSSVNKGTIIVKHTYKKNPDGSDGDLFVTFAMVKREEGYNPEAKDWEFIKIPYDDAVNYTKNPNGILPDASNADLRGKLAGCIGCHSSAAGGDYLFVND